MQVRTFLKKKKKKRNKKSVYKDADCLGLGSDHLPTGSGLSRHAMQSGSRAATATANCFSLHTVELKPAPQRAENHHSTTYLFPAQTSIQRSLISESSCIIKEHISLLPPTPAHVEDSCLVSSFHLGPALPALSRAGMDPTMLLSAFPCRR